MKRILMMCLAINTACGSTQMPSEKEGMQGVNQNSASDESGSLSDEISAKSGFVRTDNPATSQRDRRECSQWVYQEDRLTSDLAQMKQAKQEEWGRLCYQFSCAYQGTANIDGKRKEITVNAGGWIMIADEQGENVQYFISKKMLHGFLATCDCCE